MTAWRYHRSAMPGSCPGSRAAALRRGHGYSSPTGYRTWHDEPSRPAHPRLGVPSFRGAVPVSGRGIAVVTGGSAGVGREAVRHLAAAGWDVAVLARGRAGVEAAAAEVTRLGRCGLAIQCDVADAAQVDAAAERVERELGPI